MFFCWVGFIINCVLPKLRSYKSHYMEEQVTRHDQHAKQRSFQVGQNVMVKNMRPGSDWIPAVIAQQLGPVSFLLYVVDVKPGLR